MSRQGPIHDEI